MKTNQTQTKSNRGSALVITMSVVSLAVLALAGYLITIQSQLTSVSRSQTWNATISLAEAGMEEGMAMINYGYPNPQSDRWAWTNYLGAAGWTVNGTTATKTTYVYGSNYYVASIDWSSGTAPVISSAGVVSYNPIPWVFSALRQKPFLGAAGVGVTTYTNVSLGRKIQASTVFTPLFNAAIVCKSTFDMKGYNCLVDSFDSTDPSHSVGGMYSAALREANGNVATDSVLTNSINVGNGKIYGSVFTGPGSQQACVDIGPQGVVGDTSYIAFPKNSGTIEPGHWTGNYNMYIPDIVAPNTSGWANSLPTSSNGVITLTGTTSYVISTLPSTPFVLSGYNTIWVNGHGSWSLSVIPTNGGSLTLYLGKSTGSGDSFGWAGNGTCNTNGFAKNLQIYGLPSLTSVDFHGNAGWTGVLYAPEAAFVGGGGGNNSQDTSGAIVVNTVSQSGHWNFHYDQSLTNAGPSRGWTASGWKEIPYVTSSN